MMEYPEYTEQFDEEEFHKEFHRTVEEAVENSSTELLTNAYRLFDIAEEVASSQYEDGGIEDAGYWPNGMKKENITGKVWPNGEPFHIGTNKTRSWPRRLTIKRPDGGFYLPDGTVLKVNSTGSDRI